MTLSKMLLPAMNADYEDPTRWSTTRLSIGVSILAISLYKVVHQAIGL